jgi:hypothetical protein
MFAGSSHHDFSERIKMPVMTQLRYFPLALVAVLILSGSLIGHVASESAVRSQAHPVDALGWMSGCWEQSTPRATTREHWSRPAGGAMMGVSFTVRKTPEGDAAAGYEFLRIHQREGKVFYTALPSGQALTDFGMKSTAARSVTFENLQHDFPQRIAYSGTGADSLVVRVEGNRGGTVSGFDIGFRRVACP